jgi:class 3 adenylate cyclase/tetratricopeptide (TPR) repeat protein
MSSEREQLQTSLVALEAQRGVLGNAVVDATLAAVRAKLAALDAENPTASQTLKQVTILFLDVVGSTSLSQTLDPEEIHAIMDGALERGSAVVETHYGKVLKYAGDNLLAAFGVEEAHEDDAEHAVRCGLALLELGRKVGAEVEVAHGHAGFNVRVGIHTGGVLLGGGVDAEGSIRGMAVNIAARMEQTAPVGALRISNETYAQVRGLFEVEVQLPLLVKGVDEPIQSYLVVRAKPRSFRIGTRGIEGVATRMVGRDAELEVLQDEFKRLFTESKLAAVTVVGEAGVGKSRLLYEFEAWSEAQPEICFVFRGRANPHTHAQPFGLLRDIIAWRFQIADDDTIEAARAKLEGGIIPLFIADDGPDAAEAHAHLLGHVIGIEYRESRHIKGILSDPKQIRNRALHAAAQMFRRVSATDGSPVMLELEDLHWADNESLDFLNYLAEVNRDVAMLIVSFARPTLFERRTDWNSTEGIHQRVDLAPLGKDMSRLLASELLKKLPEIPGALRELVTGGSEGNPFYMEELVKMLIDQGAIQTGQEQWVLNPARLLSTQVPLTLTGVLQARLDGLPVAERQTLQEASVIGQIFWDRALMALDERATETLPALVQRELTLPRGDATSDGLREYAFKHQILHQVTYNTVLKRTRKELHGKLARWLSNLTGLRANDFLGITAGHYEEAGDTANAAEYHARAAEHAGTRMAHDAALEHVERALELIGQPAAGVGNGHDGTEAAKTNASANLNLRWRLLKVREETLSLQGKRPEQRANLDAMDRLADALGDDQRRAYAAFRRGFLAMRTADWATMEAANRRGALLAEKAGDDELRLNCLRLVAGAVAYQGDWREGQRIAQEALARARSLGLRRIEGNCLNTLSVIAGNILDDNVASLEFDQQCLEISRELGNKASEAVALGNIGAVSSYLGDLAQGRRYLEEALQLARSNGNRLVEVLALSGLSELALWQGDDARALTLARSARDIAVIVEARDREASALLCLGNAELALGRFNEAREAIEQAHAVALAIESAFRHDAIAGLARVAMARNDPATALREVERLIAHLDAGGKFEGVSRPRLLELTCYQVLERAGDQRANGWLERAHTNIQASVATISDAQVREGFLGNIPENREIVKAWAARQTAAN